MTLDTSSLWIATVLALCFTKVSFAAPIPRRGGGSWAGWGAGFGSGGGMTGFIVGNSVASSYNQQPLYGPPRNTLFGFSQFAPTTFAPTTFAPPTSFTNGGSVNQGTISSPVSFAPPPSNAPESWIPSAPVVQQTSGTFELFPGEGTLQG